MLLLALLGGLTLGCTLTFGPDLSQSLRLFFELSTSLEEGSATVVQSLFFPDEVTLKKKFVRVAGQLEPNGALPTRLDLVAETVDAESGKKLHTFKLSFKVSPNGSFEASKKFSKNLAPGSLMTITVEPVGADLPNGTGLSLCVDVVKKKNELKGISCAGGSQPGEPAATLSELQQEIFTPSCAKGGCHDSATASEGLVLAAGSTFSQVVNVPSNQAPIRLRIEPGNPEDSYLMKKVRGDSDTSGVKMPLDGPPFLSNAQIQRLASWIENGAPDN
jgi:hypothetical protein